MRAYAERDPAFVPWIMRDLGASYAQIGRYLGVTGTAAKLRLRRSLQRNARFPPTERVGPLPRLDVAIAVRAGLLSEIAQ